MQTKITIHECFSCHYSNNYFNVPFYIKGKNAKDAIYIIILIETQDISGEEIKIIMV